MKNYLLSLLALTILLNSCEKEEEFEPNVEINTEINKIFKKIYPSNQETVARFFSPSITFNYPIDTVFQLEVNGEIRNLKIEYTFSLKCDEIDVLTDNVLFNNDSLVLYHNEMFPDKQISLTLSCNASLMIEDGNQWYNALSSNQQCISESHVIVFYSNNLTNGWDVNINNITNQTNNYIIPNEKIIFNLNYSIDKEIDVSPYCSIKLVVNSFYLKEISEGVDVEGILTKQDSIITFTPSGMSYNKQYKVQIDLVWQYNYNGSWVTSGGVYTNNCELTTFISDNPNDINVIYSYPCINQYHFLKDEYSKGYIRFKENPVEFETSDSFFVKITSIETTEEQTIPASFTQDSLFFSYNFPSNFVSNEKVYRISFHKGESGVLESEFYSYYFRTSKSNTFQEKMNSTGETNCWTSIYMTGVHSLCLKIENNYEALDYWESRIGIKYGLSYNNGLIKTENIIEESSWFQTATISKFTELVEKYYYAIKWRDIDFYERIPRKNTAVISTNLNNHPGFLNSQIISEGAITINPNPIILNNFVVIIANRDYNDINNYLINNGMESPNLGISWFFENSIKYNVKYELPGINLTTSFVNFTYYY